MESRAIPFISSLSLETSFPNKKKNHVSIDSADRMYSRAVSRIRQPIESLFNCLQEKAKIQIASKVRSTKGLLIHVFGRLSAGLMMMKV